MSRAALEKLVRDRVSGNGPPLPDDQESRKAWPFLWELLTAMMVLDGQAKRPARLTVSLGVGRWVVGLSDEDLAMSLETTAGTLLEAFAAVEKALCEGTHWKVWTKKRPRLVAPEKRRKKKD